jgi:RNA polymerase sigma-70 factor (ECF subfamily)
MLSPSVDADPCSPSRIPRPARHYHDGSEAENVTRNAPQPLADRFEADRAHLGAVAYRMLGSRSEAEDAVQEAWLRLSRSDTSGVENLRGWLTTVVARICLDVLRARRSRREEHLDTGPADAAVGPEPGLDPEQEALMADAVGLALLVVLDTLSPAERVAFVLHDSFDLPFDEIAPILGRTPTAARKLASRARRRVRSATANPSPDPARQREVVDAFLAAARGGDFEALLAVLAPDVVLRADRAIVLASARGLAGDAPKLVPETRGADAVARVFVGRAAATRRALVDGAPGAAWARAGRPRAALAFTIEDGRIVAIEILADPERLEGMDVRLLED